MDIPEWYILDDDGNPTPSTIEENARWAVDNETKRRIRLDEIGDVTISTVFLGLDHNWGCGPPLLFETMVFGGKLDTEMERYNTREQAIAGHEAMVRKVKEQTNGSA